MRNERSHITQDQASELDIHRQINGLKQEMTIPTWSGVGWGFHSQILEFARCGPQSKNLEQR